jgi:hypothetical protein
MPALEFSVRHAYSPFSVGIEIPIILSSGVGHEARLTAKWHGRFLPRTMPNKSV